MRRSFPPLRLLTTFEAVLRSGGVQNAAHELNVTQPAISQALKGLEEHIGTQLLDRGKRPAGLTPAGQILYRAVSNGLDQIAGAIDQIKALDKTAQNVVTIGCTICAGSYWLMPRLAAFYSRYPEAIVRVITSATVPRFEADTDLVIRYGSGDWTDGDSELLFRERLVPVCRPEDVPRFGSGDLAKATLLHVENVDDHWPGWSEYFAATGLADCRQGDRMFSNYVEATQAAVAGIGVMLGWVSNSGDLLREGRLAVFRDQPVSLNCGFYLVTPKSRARKLAALNLERCLRESVVLY